VRLFDGSWVRADELEPYSESQEGKDRKVGLPINRKSRVHSLSFSIKDYVFAYSKGVNKVRNNKIVTRTVNDSSRHQNHIIEGIVYEGVREVYDLEVESYGDEDTHNFFADELCVHNCKSPNFQNMPSGAMGEKIRGCFKARPGFEYMSADFENLEVWIGAYFMDDKALQAILEQGINFHDFNTEVFFKITKPTKEEAETEEGKIRLKRWNSLRKVAKVIVFARINNMVLE